MNDIDPKILNQIKVVINRCNTELAGSDRQYFALDAYELAFTHITAPEPDGLGLDYHEAVKYIEAIAEEGVS